MSRRRRITAVGIALALSASSAAQQPVPQTQTELPRFRAGVELVQLDVSVLDGDRRPVTGLTAADFIVLENGRERPIRAFTPVRLPGRSALPNTVDGNTAKADVATNHVANQDGRLVFIVMDRSIPVGQPTLAANKIAIAAVEALGPNDLAAVMSTSGGIPQTLTADRSKLIAAITQRDWSTELTKEQLEVFGDPLVDGRCLCGLCVLNTLTRLADAAHNVPRRRKMLLFIGNSIVFQAPEVPNPWRDVGCVRATRDAQGRLFDALALANLTVHSIDPAGMVNLGAVSHASRAGASGGRGPADPVAVRKQMFQTETNEHLSKQGSLRVLPELTGGRAVMNTNAPEEGVPAIFEESGSYYLLAFEPSTPPREDEKRKIEVRVRRDGVHVHAQRQYSLQPISTVAAAGAKPPGVSVPLQQALRGVLPNPDRPLTMALAAFAGAGSAKPLVTVNVDAGAFAVPGGTPVPLDFAVVALDRFGRQKVTARQRSTVTFRQGSASAAVEANVQTQLELEPGDYEIRLGVSDPARNVAASVYSELTVPKFGSEPLSLSDVTFDTTGRGAGTTTAPGPTTRRVFARDEQARAIAQVYQRLESDDPVRPVEVRVRIADANGRSIRDQIIKLTEREFTDRRASVAVDLQGLAGGDYVLSISASMADFTSERAVGVGVR